MITLTMGLVILAVYLTVVIIKDGKIPPSISDTYYTSGKWVFSVVMAIEAILLSVSLFGVTADVWQWLVFLTCGGLLFVASAPHCHDDYEKKIHYAGAFTFAIGSQVWYWIEPARDNYLVMGIVFGAVWAIAGVCIMKWKANATFIAEIACIVVIAWGRCCLIG